MSKTVQELIEEYKNRRIQATLEELIIKVGDQTLCFKEVVNFKIIGDGSISFDYNDYELEYDKCIRVVKSHTHWKHIVCSGTILLMKEAIGEDF
jgi:hypothetical protein